jgi:hypothetical protein
MELKRYILKEHVLVFFFCLAVLSGPCLSILFTTDLSEWTDCKTYLALAHFDFDQSPVRRYRIIIPFIAGALDAIGSPVFDKLAPSYYQGDFSLPFCFFLVNSVIMAFFCLLVYRYCRVQGTSRLAALTGLIFLLSARFTYYFAALPFVDSLYCLVIAMTLLGIREKNTPMLVTCIFLGPFAKEAFIFIAPLIFFFSHIKRSRSFILFAASGLLVFSFHYLYDHYFPPRVVNWFLADIYHFLLLKDGLRLMFSFYGAYKIFLNIGIWIILPFVACHYSPGLWKGIRGKTDLCMSCFLLSVLFQMVLSGSLERMVYLAMPFFALVIAMSFDGIKEKIRLA